MIRTRSVLLVSLIAVMAAMFCLAGPAPAAVLTWDPAGDGSGSGGAGTWNLSLWSSSGSDVTWSDNNDALFQGTGGAVTLSAPVTATSLTFNSAGYSITGNTLTLAGDTPTITTSAASGTIGSVIAGTSGLTTTGPGTLTLTGANTYSGATVVSTGTLKLAGIPSGYVGYYSFDNTNGSTVINGGSGGAAYNGTLFGTAAITSGGLNGGSAMSLPSSTDQSGLYLGTSGIPVPNGQFTASLWFYGLYGGTGYRTAFKNRTGADDMYFLNADGNQNLEAYSQASGGFQFAGPTQFSMSGYANQPAWHMLTVVGNGTNSTYYVDGAQAGSPLSWVTNLDIGQVGGAASDANRNLAQKIDEVYVYNTALTAGQVQQLYTFSPAGPAANSLPAGTPLSIAGGASVDLSGVNPTIGSLSGGGTVTNTCAGSTVLLTINGDGGNFSGVIQDGGAGMVVALSMTGGGTQVLSGANTHSGATTINSGVLQLANANAVQNSTVVVNANSGLQFATGVGTFTLGGLAGTGSMALQDTASGAVTLQVGNNNASSLYGGNLSGAGGLVKTGTGTLTLTGIANSYTGATRVTQGTLQLGGAPVGAVASYSFNNVSGSTIVNDGSGGAAYNGTLFGSGTIAVGAGLRGGNAMALPANSPGCLMLGSSGIAVGSGNFTASLWFYGLYGNSYGGSFENYTGEGSMYILDSTSNHYLEAYSGGFKYATPNQFWLFRF